jgi:hypothetical protein
LLRISRAATSNKYQAEAYAPPHEGIRDLLETADKVEIGWSRNALRQEDDVTPPTSLMLANQARDPTTDV